MDTTPAKSSTPRYLILQLALAVLTIVTLIILLAEEALPLPREVQRLVQGFDLFVCSIFLLDFTARFYAAPSKRAFMKWGWIDLIACIPNIDLLRAGRIVRLLRIIRLIRTLRSTHRLAKIFLLNRTSNSLVMVFLTMLLVAIFASAAILIAESGDPHANITSAGDAIWWALTTLTTVGYGDRYPMTVEGRLVAIVLMFCGVGLFGTFSGLVATWMLGPNHAEDSSPPDLSPLLTEIATLRTALEAQSSAHAQHIQSLLTKLESTHPITGAIAPTPSLLPAGEVGSVLRDG